MVITRHAHEQAFLRRIAYPEHVMNTILTGRMVRFGKQYAKFIGRDGVTRITEITPTKITIITVERGNTP